MIEPDLETLRDEPIYSEECPDCGMTYSVLADSPEAAAASLFSQMEWHRRERCKGVTAK